MKKRYVGVAELGPPRTVTVMVGDVPQYTLEPTAARRVGGYVVNRWFWGDNGQECKALALAILLDVCPDQQAARRHHLTFWRQVVGKLLVDRWSLDGEQVSWWVRQAEALSRAGKALVSRAEDGAASAPVEWPWSEG